jgi:cell division protein FtsW
VTGTASTRSVRKTASPAPARAEAAPREPVGVRGWLRRSMPSAVGHADPVLLALVVALIAFGVVMVFSASAVFASQSRFTHHDGHYFLVRQALYALVAVPVMLLVSRMDYRRWQPLTYPVLALTTILMIATLFVGHRVGGAIRWIQVGPVNIQAAELAKVAVVLYLAHSLGKKSSDQIRSFKVGILPHLLVLGVLALLCWRQNDLGSAMMLGILTFVMLFAGGAKVGPIALVVLGAAGIAAIWIRMTPWRMQRIEAFLDPFAHRQGSGYQVVESILSFGSGGWTGVGLGDSRQKLFFLPEAHTDFIGAIIGEELGFVGVVLLVLAFAGVVVRGYRAAFRAADEHGALLAVGLTTFIGASAFANLAVAMGLLPTKGLVLPFISYGGSSLLVCAGAMGIVLSVSRDRAVPVAPGDAGAAGDASSEEGVEGDRRSSPELVLARTASAEAGAKAAGGVPSNARASAIGGLRGATS